MNWSKFAAIAKLILPIVGALVPHGDKLAPAIVDAITEAEAIKGASGAEKKAHVLSVVGDAITAANESAGKTVIDPGATLTAASSTIDTTVSVINLIHAQHPTGIVPPNVPAQGTTPQPGT